MTKCLDAETIAALMDGSLTERERNAAEAHAADCDRCLAVVAAMAKTAPPAQESVRPSWFSVRWLVPVATAAVVLVAWVLVQDPAEPVRHVDTAAAPASEPAPAAAPSAELPRDATAQAKVGGAAGASTPAPPAATEARKPGQSARRDDRAKTREETANREQLDRLARDGLVPMPKSVVTPPPPPAAPPPSATAPQAAGASVRAFNEVVQHQQVRSALAPTLVVSPDPNVRWRIAGLVVERSIDGGGTWTVQPTGTPVPLSSGASPAPGVCWVVGSPGVVLLTSDGETWRRLEFPDANAQLVAVSARDALSATVTAADGRTYRTDDGGKTWRMQENPAAAF